ncbi:PadR family transcriptional regulator [Paenibacillus sambharensis]|uniref:PadR family transcriptional regulator n=1 Tax=Paenibacillus sambharensis TaxID=1803190 RepID=A0A2W1LF15_9BACL|nr:PadR family transcriptional regulator [Paenibacillus sambharensis]PZD97423.1 PadR family transcriptional regulator [Paenibacillus sambharensis]
MRYYHPHTHSDKQWGSHGFHRGSGGQERFARHRHGGWQGGRGGRGEGKRRFFERGEFKFALLELLAAKPMHGYQLIKAMEEKTGGLYTPSAGSVYPNLQLLEEMNLIGSEEAEGKKLYRITDEGVAHLGERREQEAERQDERWDRHRKHHRPHGGKHGRRELHGLMQEWSEVVYLLAGAAGEAQVNPSSKQAKDFQELMADLQTKLETMLAPGKGDPAESPAETGE